MTDTNLLSRGKLCVVGNVNRDIKIAAIEPGQHLFEDGETSTTKIRETVGGGGAKYRPGGRVARRQRHLRCEDRRRPALGKQLERTLVARGVRCHLIRDPKVATGTSINLVWTTGRRHFVSCLPNTQTLAFEGLDAGALAGCDHLLRADPWFSEPMLLGGGNRRLFQAARSAGLAVSLDINWDPHWGKASDETISHRKRALRDALPLVNLAHGNVRELCAFAGADDLDRALSKLADWGVEAVVIHMGERGAGYFANGKLIVETSVPADRVVNTTGTGDVLSVCMMLLHARTDLDVRDKLRLCNQVVAEYISGRRDLAPELLQ